MKLIIGLGNPGQKYEQTRHNVGFMAVDELARERGAEWQEAKKLKGLLAKSGDIILFKPQNFMNLSGQAIKAAMQFYKIELTDIAVIHDDIDIDLGKYKTTDSSRSAGHNGVQSIIDELGTQDFKRFRIGVRTPESSLVPSEKFVLDKFNADELISIKTVIKDAVLKINETLK
jgi:peptidyl-tRNA hydrolase, PTH1 family